MYGNDREAAKALQRFFAENTSFKRHDLWITSKLSTPEAYLDVTAGCRAIIDRVGCGYLDLLLLHCPIEFLAKTHLSVVLPSSIDIVWKEMEKLVSLGLVRHIGVSNFRISDLDELLATATIKPFLNQVEFNPYLQQPGLVAYCIERGIAMEAYSPQGPINLWPEGPLDPLLGTLAAKYDVEPSSILLSYAMQKGLMAVTTTSKRERMDEALRSIALRLDETDVLAIDELGARGSPKRKYWTDCY